ncbi:hypothetical protein CONPUDRAFT_49943 [Coniophora puteana RWD-64-598 SS2]|uniref:Uncharacterized protein n=1 Tax=Coniophora puteana (strain RWD-64-598) TaxID=741705 RepID=A0A5M3N0X9_CONPW|nr:uncharacterized protein CONPUDRAFT_49943 [Coniophora puteana RWD-64-598 SS2]EIW84541.1 hypothetical protein CONPUDRAFT_49943 [Coniophora puteana RWD-64-598 SS2]
MPTPPLVLDQVYRRVELDARVHSDLAGPDDDDDAPEPYEPPTLVPRAFKEKPEIRHAYLRAVLENVFNKVPVLNASKLLSFMLDNLSIVAPLPIYPKPVKTLQSAKRRLGIDADQYIIKYAVCPDCWKHYHPNDLMALESPICTVTGCSGNVYVDTVNARGKHIRKPIKAHPQVSLIASLRRMFMRPGFAHMIRDSRADVSNRNDDSGFIMRDMHDGALWHQLDTHTVREVGERGHVRDRPEDGRDTAPKLTSHRYGLHLTCNVDWMGILENRPHSTGAMYIAINDLPRDQRFLQVNTICLSVMPGPKEPDSRQISHCMEPMAKELINLTHGCYQLLGVDMDVHGEDEQASIYADCACLDCDMPASHKCNGTSSHSSDMHPCLYCEANILDIDKPSGYDHTSNLKDDFKLLRHAYRSRNATEARQAQILEDHGKRFVVLDLIPGWLPKTKTAPDFMHAVFLGIIPHLYDVVIFGGYVMTGVGGANSAKARFESLINSISWPSHITRLPKNLGENHSLKKADEWRRLIAITPVLLWWTWRDEDDVIPHSEPVLPPNTTAPSFSRNRQQLYDAILLLCAAVRILSSREISMDQARIGQSFLAQYCERFIALGIPLRPNHHVAMHTADVIRLFGPVYAWWLFAFERFNGMLERVKHNGHDGGEMELTLMRAWVQGHLIYEYLISLPPGAHKLERDALDEIIKTQARNRGAMMTEIAIYQSEAAEDNVRLPSRAAKFVNLRAEQSNTSPDLYRLLLGYCRRLWPDLKLASDRSCRPDTTPFVSHRVARALSYVRKDGIRYGSTTNRRTQADAFAFINDSDSVRVPVRIHSLYSVVVGDKQPHVCAVIERLVSDENIPALPWGMFSTMLGIYVCYADVFRPFEVIPVSSIQCSIGLIPITLCSCPRPLWAAVSFDHVSLLSYFNYSCLLMEQKAGTEPEEFFE